ncbi:hypothetical protein [Pedobacter sp. ASV28]|uniref:hypothetical protein n=1 Tax=Pedobacter sp. ASV28 TaxID=2795123 RepID=UPI0018EE0D3D|nr:hypothetical protein [Pedobacter sp. ASV28]
MKVALTLIFCTFLFISCRPNKQEQVKEANNIVAKDTTSVIKLPDTSGTEVQEADLYGEYYITIADTSKSYHKLNKKMFELSQLLAIQIDTLGRFYDKEKDLISLPKDTEDEIYAGDYFPRRELSESLSLEYLKLYSSTAHNKTISLVSGIYADEKSADSALRVLKKVEPKAFKLKSKIYIGCMH